MNQILPSQLEGHFLSLFPLAIEKKLFIKAIQALNFKVSKISAAESELDYIAKLNMICGVGGHGKVSYALTAQHFLTYLPRPKALLCMGAGGGLSPDAVIGDLVVGLNTIEHDYHQKFTMGAAKPQFPSASYLQDLFLQNQSNGFNILKGDIASGDEDIVDTVRAEALFAETQALAVGWEGAGAGRAARRCLVDFIEIRAITDNARTKVASDFKANLGLAMDNLAHLMCSALVSQAGPL